MLSSAEPGGTASADAVAEERSAASTDVPDTDKASPSSHFAARVRRWVAARSAIIERRMRWFRAQDRQVLVMWLLTRLAVLWTAVHAAWLFDLNPYAPHPVPYLERWATWDAARYIEIAEYGYQGRPINDAPLQAFFPGLPLLLRAVHVVISDWRLAGLIISGIAGCIVVIAQRRLTALDHGPLAGRRAALILALCPFTVFLTAGYTETLFLAFAVAARLQARRGRWWAAGLLAAGASSVRVTGIFLAVALIVEFGTGWLPTRLRRHRPDLAGPRLRDAPYLLVPFLPLLAYSGYLRVTKGDWLYWFTAERLGWERHYVGFVQSFQTTMRLAAGTNYPPGWQWIVRLDIAMVAVGVLLIAALLWRAQYGEATFVAASLIALTTSTSYFSIGRTALLWWPLWTMLGALAARPRLGPWFTRILLGASIPLALLLITAFTSNRWAG